MKTQNIVTMTMGQVTTGRDVIGLIAENKVKDNVRYAITAMDAEAGEITFTEILSDDAPEGTVADVVVITAANADTIYYSAKANLKENMMLMDRAHSCFLLIILNIPIIFFVVSCKEKYRLIGIGIQILLIIKSNSKKG